MIFLGYSKSTCKSIYLMDLEKINYELIESVLLWIVEGDHNYPKEGSILVSVIIFITNQMRVSDFFRPDLKHLSVLFQKVLAVRMYSTGNFHY